MATIAMHLAVAIWNTTVTHENHELMNRLWVLRSIVPESSRIISVCKMCGWMALLRVDEMWEFGWIPQKENRCVVEDHIPVALIRSQLDGESTRVASAVMRARLATNGREADRNGAGLALLEDIGRAKILETVGCLVVAMSTAALCVDNALRNTLAVEM